MVLLVGNYPADRLHSMDRFARMMLHGLSAQGIPARLIVPKPSLGLIPSGAFARKWLGYFDKFLIFPRELQRATASASLVHICDHSNSPYVGKRGVPTVVTCHDLLAVRAGLGEPTDHPPSIAGKILQRWILRGLKRASAIVCVSDATRQDVERLVTVTSAKPKLETIHLGPDAHFKPEPLAQSRIALSAHTELDLRQPFVLHVGSNLRRKNREGVLKIFARVQERWPGQLVFAGEALTESLAQLARELGLAGRIVQIVETGNEQLRALYNCARVLLYPSRSEGFGWPIIEAQACGCPVVCSDAAPLPEVAGAGALLRSQDDEAGFAEDLVRLLQDSEYERWKKESLKNAERFSTADMVRQYVGVYRSMVPAL